MAEDIAPEVAETSPEPEDSPTPAIEQEAVAAQEPDSPPADAEPKRSRAEERIAELVAERTAAKEAGEYWRELAISLQKEPVAQEPVKSDPKPTLEQFDHDPEKYANAISDWTVGQVQQQVQAQVAESTRQAASANAAEQIEAQWREKSAEFSVEHADFNAVISNPVLPINEDMTRVIWESDQGPAIAYHLGKNPDVAAKIKRMTPLKMTLALGRLERDLSAPEPQPTKAPAPPNPVGGQQPTVDIGSMDIDSWMAHERARLSQKRGR